MSRRFEVERRVIKAGVSCGWGFVSAGDAVMYGGEVTDFCCVSVGSGSNFC